MNARFRLGLLPAGLRILGVMWRSLLLAMLLMLVGGAYVVSPPKTFTMPKDSPELIFDDSVAGDFRMLSLHTWDQFLTVFWSRKNCFGDVYLKAAHTLGNRAVYDPESATVTVRVPAAAATLQAALIHEWAHHIEFQCIEQAALRPAFLIAQGLPSATSWRMLATHGQATSAWAQVPSEQYAEATVALVLGRRSMPTPVRLTPEAIAVIEKWAAGNLH